MWDWRLLKVYLQPYECNITLQHLLFHFEVHIILVKSFKIILSLPFLHCVHCLLSGTKISTPWIPHLPQSKALPWHLRFWPRPQNSKTPELQNSTGTQWNHSELRNWATWLNIFQGTPPARRRNKPPKRATALGTREPTWRQLWRRK